jgi:anthranilate synthase component II
VVVVVKNDRFDLDTLGEYDRLVISPGPGLPGESGILMELVRVACGKMPVLGVCMGMQALAVHAGFELYNMEEPLHGLMRDIEVSGGELFWDLPAIMPVGLYHSWAVRAADVQGWKITAQMTNGIVMAMENPVQKAFGVQFHPESVMTKYGRDIVRNFLRVK